MQVHIYKIPLANIDQLFTVQIRRMLIKYKGTHKQNLIQ